MSQFSVGFQSTLQNSANYFVAAVYDMSNLVTPFETFPVTKPGGGYPPTFQVTFLNSYTANKLYRVILWENTTPTLGGTSRCSSDIKASVAQALMRPDSRYIYGTTGTFTNNTTIVDASLIGWNISFEQFGSGTLNPGVDYTFDNTTGTIVLINGTTYQNGQNMIVHFLPQITNAPSSSSGISTGSIVAVSTTLTSAISNSAIYLQGSGGSFIATLPVLSTMMDYQPVEFYSYGGNHINVRLLCQGTDKIQWNVLRTSIVLGQGEEVTLFKANGVWNVKHPSPFIKMAGEIVYRYGKDNANVDFPYVIADGSLLNRLTYSRLFDYFSLLPGAALVAEASWGNSSTLDGSTYYPNKGFWTVGDGSTTFRVPLLFNQFIRGADGSSRQPGSFQADAMQSHSHDTGMAPTNGHWPFGRTPSAENVGGDTGQFSFKARLTGPPYNLPGTDTDGALITKVSTETRPENISLYALIRL